MVGARPRNLFPKILFLLAATAWCQGFDETAGALARKIAAHLEPREAVMLGFTSVGSASPSEEAGAREAIERELRALGVNTTGAGQAGAVVTVTFSENIRGSLWAAEIRHGDARELVMEERPKLPARAGTASITIDKKLMLDEDERILDLAPSGHGLVVLDASAVSLYESSGGTWERRLSVPIPVSRPWPRDLRGRLTVQGDVYQAYLPGLTCNGNAGGGMSIMCREEGLWPLGPKARGLSIPTRNFFESFVLPDGLQKRMPAFFSAATFADRGPAAWIFAATDGRTHLYNAAFEPGASWGGWGSDIAAVESECGSRTLLLSTGHGDGTVPDFVQAYELTGSAPSPVGDPVTFSGPVTALWAASERGAAVAVSRDLKSGRYAAIRLSIPCSR